jgi:hypothetical protein
MMIRRIRSLPSKIAAASVLLSLGAVPAWAHVGLDYPNGGEVFREADVVTIEWHVIIQHSLIDWDLWYSTTSGSGPWVPIAMDLPPGDPSPGSYHTYDWAIPPEAVSNTVWVRVRQDNSGMDYEDVSDNSFIILPEFALLLNQSDLLRGQQATFQVTGAEEGERVFFIYSVHGEGDGPAVPLLGGLRLDILLPIELIGQAFADQSGTATIQVPVPPGVPLIDVSTQAVIRRGQGGILSVKSNPITDTIQP